jgi:hypothetical protein
MNDTLTDEFIKMLFALITLIITAILPPLLVKLYQLMGLKKEEAEIAAKQTTELAERLKIRNLLLGVEEWAASKIKAGATDITSKIKLEKLLNDAAANGLTDSDRVFKLAHEEMAKVGIGSSAAKEPTMVLNTSIPLK